VNRAVFLTAVMQAERQFRPKFRLLVLYSFFHGRNAVIWHDHVS